MMDLPLSLVSRLQKEYNCSIDTITEAYKSCFVFGRCVSTVEEVLRRREEEKKYHLLSFCYSDGDIYGNFNVADYQDSLYERFSKRSLSTDLRRSDVVRLRSLRLTGALANEVDSLGEEKTFGVRYDGSYYSLTSKDVSSFLAYCKNLKVLQENYDKSIEELADVYKNHGTKVKPCARLLENYVSNFLASKDFDVEVDKILNFGSWLLNFARVNYGISNAIILLDKVTCEAHIFVSVYSFLMFINSSFETNKLHYEDELSLISKYSQYGVQDYKSCYEYYLSKNDITNFIIMED